MTDVFHRNLLKDLKEILEETMGLSSTLVEPSESMPLVSLSTALKPDEKQRDRAVNHALFPFSEADMEHTLLLQFFFQLPFALNTAHLTDVALLLQTINNRIPLGCYSLNTDEQSIQFRYIMPLPNHVPLNSDLVGEVMVLLIVFQDLFPPVIESLNTGEATLQEALQATYALEQ
ncbi:MAG: hypothetical protein ACAF41_15640 [Leptolyngbya sp. BL-A-14]